MTSGRIGREFSLLYLIAQSAAGELQRQVEFLKAENELLRKRVPKKRIRVVHFNVTGHPSAAWTARQIVEAFPFDSAPKYLVRDNDGIYGREFSRRMRSLGIEEVRIAPRSPWQNAYVERLIGSVRRECLNHVMVLGEAHLKRLLAEYFAYCHDARTHQSLQDNAPSPRDVEPPERGPVVAQPMVGGLHHRYSRRAA